MDLDLPSTPVATSSSVEAATLSAQTDAEGNTGIPSSSSHLPQPSVSRCGSCSGQSQRFCWGVGAGTSPLHELHRRVVMVTWCKGVFMQAIYLRGIRKRNNCLKNTSHTIKFLWLLDTIYYHWNRLKNNWIPQWHVTDQNKRFLMFMPAIVFPDIEPNGKNIKKIIRE